VKISVETKALLDGLKVHKKQPYDEIISKCAQYTSALKTSLKMASDAGMVMPPELKALFDSPLFAELRV
jgi:hypothetical protein